MDEDEQSSRASLKRTASTVHCGVSGCRTTRRRISTTPPLYKFFTLPKDSDRKAVWLQKMGLHTDRSSTRYYICEKHFENKYINNNSTRKRLVKTAVPTLFLPSTNESPPSPQFAAAVQIKQLDPIATTSSSHTDDTPAKRLLNEKLEYQQPTKRVKIKEEPGCLTVFVKEESEEEIHEENVTVSQLQYIQEIKKPPKVRGQSRKRKYSPEFKIFGLELYFRSPNSYRLLQRTFSLPRISSLYRLCIPATTELSQSVLAALTIRARSMTYLQKQCVVCVGTMNIAPNIQYDATNDKTFGFHEVDGVQTLEPARNVLIVMVRGLFHNWKQAVAFSFLADFRDYSHVKHFIDEIIRRLFQMGLNVRVLMSDLESDPLTGAKDRGFNSRNPFFFLDLRKIYYMHDPLNLMRNVRDNLFSHNFTFYSGLVARWQHILECYEFDCKKSILKLAPKLSIDHVKPDNEAKDDLRLTTEVFSKATATAISTYIDLKMLPPIAKDTVQWIITMNKLMEMLNFGSIDPPEDKSAIFNGDTSQIDFLVGMLSLFYNLRLSSNINGTPDTDVPKDNAPFIEGFRVTINAVFLLYGALKTENCWHPVVGLSQDCLNLFFDKVRLKYRNLPKCNQMIQCINEFPIFNIFQYSCRKRSPNDLENFTSHVRAMPDIEIFEQEATNTYVDICAEVSAEFCAVELPRENRMEHLALFLLYKGYQKHSDCDVMKEYACTDDIIEGDSSVMPLVGYKTRCNKINMVPREFVEFVEVMELKFKEYFKENRLTRSISGLSSFVKNVTFEMPCECFPLQFVKQLYLRYRFHLVMAYNNKLFKSTDCKTAFVVNDLSVCESCT